jgi:uncharacterized membrane protein (DUF106 family)
MVVIEFINANPLLSIILISLVATFLATLAHKWLTNQEHLKSMKARQKELQKELKACQKTGDDCKMKELNAEMMKIAGTMMKSSFRPMIVTMVPFFILIYWIRSIYSPILNYWIWWYIGASVASSIIIRKVLKVA